MKKKEELNAVVSEDTSEDNKAEVTEETESVKALDAAEETAEAAEQPVKKKKGPIIQIPVLISLLIVVLSAVGYFIYSSYFLHLPQGIVWKEVKDGITHYYEFSEDNMFTDTWASYERSMTYEELNEGGKDVMRIHFPEGVKDFECEMTGSRLKKNQTLTLIDSDGDAFITCDQVESKDSELELPTEFQSDAALTGEWTCRYNDMLTEDWFFNPDGSMKQVVSYRFSDGTAYIETYNMTYTISNGYVFFTYVLEDEDPETGAKTLSSQNDHRPYQVEGDYLIFLKNVYTRVKAPATPDEA